MTGSKQNNQKVLHETHFLSCDEIGKGNDNCKCLEPKHHVGAFQVAVFLGLTERRKMITSDPKKKIKEKKEDQEKE